MRRVPTLGSRHPRSGVRAAVARHVEALWLDLGSALRMLRRAPALSGTALLLLALGVGAGMALIPLGATGLRHAAPVSAPAGLPLPVPDAGAVNAPPAPPLPPARVVWDRVASPGAALPRTIEQSLRANLRTLLRTLQGATLLALLIAACTTALLLVSRGLARRREVAMRVVLGTPRGRLARLFAAEGALLAAAGALGGILLAAAAVAALRAGWPRGVAPWLAGPLDWRLAALGAAPSLLAVLLASLAPLAGAGRPQLHARVSQGERSTVGPGEGRARERLAMLAVATAVALLAASGLLLRGFATTAPGALAGIDPRDTLALQLEPPRRLAGDPAGRAAYLAAVVRQVQSTPGVRAGSVASPGSWTGLGTTGLVHALTGNPARPGLLRPARYHAVGPGYFRALGARVAEGREFQWGDRAGAPRVAVVSRTFAHRFFPGVAAIGRDVQLGGMSLRGEWYRVVGVVEDVRAAGLGTPAVPEPAIYLSALQVPPAAVGVAVRTAGDPLAVRDAVLAAIHRVDAGGQVSEVETLEAHLAAAREPLRWLAGLFGAVAALVLGMAAVGVFGVIAHGVAQRTREIGVRMALGARAWDVVWMVMRRGLRLAAAGSVLGVAGALCLGRLLQFLLFGVELWDPALYLATSALLGGAALVASYLPARRAARVPPAVALRAP